MSWDIEAFRQKLEDQHEFPGQYKFKFIVPHDKREEIVEVLPFGEITYRDSSNKKYVSVTAVAEMETSQGVLDVYIEANKIEGCIAL
ncbi:MAG: DUF493 domain-containing protein [Flammeovirgaceae bacterium]|nr:DUF493 domain-containing protein [Flammeovirgaceae bacterium]MBE62219.1 DUF493 domain-containing protein [Flammeovirgaceae bacterium]MBR08951.1 DUF493 domain-containing protein [Rickettsiales bacterium]HCX22258.1 DUF493 domain-containing protein [Cytophagales bacterium]|tara:strand:+ start:386 stop:646 length:261 start_codon:yes stop_codon:yes gene_type:complete